MYYRVIDITDRTEVFTGTYEQGVAFIEANKEHQLDIEPAE